MSVIGETGEDAVHGASLIDFQPTVALNGEHSAIPIDAVHAKTSLE